MAQGNMLVQTLFCQKQNSIFFVLPNLVISEALFVLQDLCAKNLYICQTYEYRILAIATYTSEY